MNAEIYSSQSDGNLFSPFNLKIDPMERLLLLNFQKDPDSVYTAFEPQVFDDPVNGQGMMVIAYLHNGKVDIYHQPGLTLEHKNYDIVGKGLAELIERPMGGAHFDTTSLGIDLAFAFEDKTGRPIAVRIKENMHKPVDPFAILAPMGSAAEQPPALPLVLLYDFYFVRKSGTEIEIKIDGKRHKPDSIPMILDGTRVHFIRYATDPFIVTWNESHDGPLTALKPEAGTIRDADVIYDVVDNSGHPEIQRMRVANDKHELCVTFNPPMPDVVCLKNGAQVDGRFTITCEESSGKISGVYQVRREVKQVKLDIHPSGGWQPNERKWSVKFIFLIASVFKQWPKTYRWSATIDLSDEDQPVVRSGWERLDK